MATLAPKDAPGAVVSLELGARQYPEPSLAALVARGRPQAIPVSRPSSDQESPIYRSALSPRELSAAFASVRTLHDLFEYARSKYARSPVLGSRAPPSVPGGQWAPYSFISYEQLANARTDFACGLQKIYIDSVHGSPADRWNLGIFSINRTEWIVADLAAHAFGLAVVALYDTLGADTTEFILNHADVPVVVASIDKLPILLSISQKTPKLKVIIALDSIPSADARGAPVTPLAVARAWARERGIALYTYSEVIALGAKNQIPLRPPAPEDTFCICYTSGTTGNPKGAILTHSNMIAFQRAAHLQLGLNASDVHISYLPLAHIFERCVSACALFNGASIGFYRGDVSLLIEDIGILRPTLFPSVPRLFNRIYDRITQQALHSGSALKAALFQRALDAKIGYLRSQGSLHHSLWDTLVFSKAKAILGGRVRLMVSASAPISGQVMEFLRVAFSCNVIEAYGQTESTGGLSVSWPGDHSRGHVGPVLSCNELKLVSVPEMNYHARDLKGEVCVRGPNVFKGYHKDVAKTKETITEDGWLLTGDIGAIDSLGRLSIIDRKKNIFKLAQGEYIAPEKIENTYIKSTFVAQIYVHGDSLQNELVAIVVPDPEFSLKWAQGKGLAEFAGLNGPDVARQPGQPPHPCIITLCKNASFRDTILHDMNTVAKHDKLRGFEYVKAIHVEPVMFSVESGLLTPTFKLKRNEAAGKYRDVIDGLYQMRVGNKVPDAKL